MAKKRVKHTSKKDQDLFSGVTKSNWHMYSQLLIGGSLIAVALAGLGWVAMDIWLAPTQWLLVSAVLAAVGVYVKLESSRL